MTKLARRLASLLFAVAVAVAGAPLAATTCAQSERSCPMPGMARGAHDCCDGGASLSAVMACCATEAAPATAPANAELAAPTVVASPPFDSPADPVLGSLHPSVPGASTADRRWAECRHALGLFTLFEVFLI